MKTVDHLGISENEHRAIQTASKMLKETFPVEEVILFGSKARGDDDDESDIDLLLVTSRPVSWQERKAINNSLYDIQLSCDVIISTLITTDKEWNRGVFSVMPIYDEVCRDGLKIKQF